MEGLYNTASSRDHNMKKIAFHSAKLIPRKAPFVFISIHTVFYKKRNFALSKIFEGKSQKNNFSRKWIP